MERKRGNEFLERGKKDSNQNPSFIYFAMILKEPRIKPYHLRKKI
jgi:hypothetical protein